MTEIMLKQELLEIAHGDEGSNLAGTLRALLVDFITLTIKGGMPYYLEENLSNINKLIVILESLEEEDAEED